MGNLENFYSCTHMQDSTLVETSDFETYNVLSEKPYVHMLLNGKSRVIFYVAEH